QGPMPSANLSVTRVSGNLQLHNAIIVEVDSLQQFLRQTGKSAAKFVLYLDWRPINGLKVRTIPGTNNLVFDIERSPDSKATWDVLLGRPFSKGTRYVIPVSVGYDAELAIRSEIRAGLLLVPTGLLVAFGTLLAFGLALLLRFAPKSQIMRDARADVPPGRLPPYSLGKSQMAFWFFLILASYLLIWIVTGEPPTVTESTLALMGISAATALGAVIVGQGKAPEIRKMVEAILAERNGLETRNAAIDAQIGAAGVAGQAQATLAEEKAANDARIEVIDKRLHQESEGFFKAILTDADGISLHRFQIVVWTMVLGLIFVISVYQTLAMPEFGSTLVALMGISAGTYLGFKFPEKQV
ncbi:MAG TPA: hypothetical protein VFU23_14150, partial [Gemmatimonadales bacterium]|nr:hypothetical protein [Gemmatimonadales bacterium]